MGKEIEKLWKTEEARLENLCMPPGPDRRPPQTDGGVPAPLGQVREA